jgi:hypothetical protein
MCLGHSSRVFQTDLLRGCLSVPPWNSGLCYVNLVADFGAFWREHAIDFRLCFKAFLDVLPFF